MALSHSAFLFVFAANSACRGFRCAGPLLLFVVAAMAMLAHASAPTSSVAVQQTQITKAQFDSQCQLRAQALWSTLGELHDDLEGFAAWVGSLAVPAWLTSGFSVLPFTQAQFVQKIATNTSNAALGHLVDGVLWFNYIDSTASQPNRDRNSWEQAHNLTISQLAGVGPSGPKFTREANMTLYLPLTNGYPQVLAQYFGWVRLACCLLICCVSVVFLLFVYEIAWCVWLSVYTRSRPRRIGKAS